jgi:Nucleotidyl transferase AbiEii toxin, Type IV TA system
LTPLETALARVSEDLRDLGVPFALVGGLAVSVHTEPRFTRDVDLAVVASDDRRAIDIVAGLQARGFGLAEQLEQEATGRLSAVRLLFGREAPVFVDLLFASSGIEEEVAVSASDIEVVPGLLLPVASAEHLIALKVLSRDDLARPQDVADIRALLNRAGGIDRNLVRQALGLIEARGYSRGRDLERELQRATDPEPKPE